MASRRLAAASSSATTRGSAARLRPISSWIHAMQRSSVPMSGPGM
jgi:hypothetical protein